MSDLTHGDLAELLRERFSPTSGSDAILFEVPSGTGSHRSRVCDALSMSLWPSKGLTLTGYEIKASRGDWLTELDEPEKSAVFRAHCDHWYLVAPAKMVTLEEVPADWGLMTPAPGGGLKVRRQAARLQPQPISRAFLAAIFRCVAKQSPEGIIGRRVQEAEQRGFWRGRRDAEERHKRREGKESGRWQKDYEKLLERVKEFEERSGVRIDAYAGNRVGDAFRLALLLSGWRPHLHEAARAMREAVQVIEGLSEEAKG